MSTTRGVVQYLYSRSTSTVSSKCLRPCSAVKPAPPCSTASPSSDSSREPVLPGCLASADKQDPSSRKPSTAAVYKTVEQSRLTAFYISKDGYDVLLPKEVNPDTSTNMHSAKERRRLSFFLTISQPDSRFPTWDCYTAQKMTLPLTELDKFLTICCQLSFLDFLDYPQGSFQIPHHCKACQDRAQETALPPWGC